MLDGNLIFLKCSRGVLYCTDSRVLSDNIKQLYMLQLSYRSPEVSISLFLMGFFVIIVDIKDEGNKKA